MNEFVEVTEIFQARVQGAYVYHKKGRVLLNKAHIVSVSEVGHEAEAFFVDFLPLVMMKNICMSMLYPLQRLQA